MSNRELEYSEAESEADYREREEAHHAEQARPAPLDLAAIETHIAALSKMWICPRCGLDCGSTFEECCTKCGAKHLTEETLAAILGDVPALVARVRELEAETLRLRDLVAIAALGSLAADETRFLMLQLLGHRQGTETPLETLSRVMADNGALRSNNIAMGKEAGEMETLIEEALSDPTAVRTQAWMQRARNAIP